MQDSTRKQQSGLRFQFFCLCLSNRMWFFPQIKIQNYFANCKCKHKTQREGGFFPFALKHFMKVKMLYSLEVLAKKLTFERITG